MLAGLTSLAKKELIALLFVGLLHVCHLSVCLLLLLVSLVGYMYSQTSLSRTRLFRITAYLELKIWPLFYYETMTTGNKIMWKRGGAISPLFHIILYIYF